MLNDRASEFLLHFGSTDYIYKYYLCQQPVPFDSTEFYDFEEKKFYYMVSNLDYMVSLESSCLTKKPVLP